MPKLTASKTNKFKPVKLPRGYISWTQLDLVEKNEDEYIHRYIRGNERPPTVEMEFGKEVAEILEGKKTTDDEIVKLVVATIPKYDVSEKDEEAMLRIMDREVKLIGKIDSDDSKTHDFLEYKTGKTKWTQQKAEKHGQLLFYKVMKYINHGMIPKSKLVWIPTEDYWEDWEDGTSQKTIVFSGQPALIFDVEHTTADVLSMMRRIMKGAERIEQLYIEELESMV